MNQPAPRIFDAETALPDAALAAKEKTLLGFEARYHRVHNQLRLLLSMGELAAWNRKHYSGKLALCELVGYRMVVVDGRQKFEHARIDQEIFAKLHRSRVVLADVTGMRPNCFLELGYAFGRSLPTMLMAKDGSIHPFDIQTFAGLHWKTVGTIDDRRRAFREHWNAIQIRPPLVPAEPLIS